MAEQTRGSCEFGPFRLDAAERLLLRDAQSVPLTPKAFDLLLALVARAGRLVAKEELLEAVWPGTFVEEANLSYNVSLLRKALGDDVAPYRYIETVTKRGYRFTAPVRACGASSRATWWPVTGAAAAIILAAISATFWFVLAHRPAGAPANDAFRRPLTRLTFDAGVQLFPTWSPDGQRIAYASERSGNLDIWVQQVAGGPPVQLTDDPAADWTPDWSPDSSRIVFRSERDGGGLFVMSALGGPARRLTTFGYRPLWSPDGSRVLFYETPPRWQRFVPRLFVVADDGSPPRAVLQNLPRPLDTCCWRGYGWHPDGRRISVFWGGPTTAANDIEGPGGWHFWTFSVDDSRVIRSEIAPDVVRQLDEGFQGNAVWFGGVEWAPAGDGVYLSSCDGQVNALWRVPVDRVTLRWAGGPERFTTGPGSASAPSLCRDGHRLAFATWDNTFRLHAFPLDASAARLTGPERLLTDSALGALMPDLSPDGRQLVYVSMRGQPVLRVRSLATGKETVLFEGDDFVRHLPRWSRDGSSLLYSRFYRGHPWIEAIARLTLASGREDLLTTPGPDLFVHGDWTADGQWVLASAKSPTSDHWRVVLMPAAAGPHADTQARVIFDDPSMRLFPHRISPDGRWVTLSGGASRRAEGSSIFVMPLAGGPLRRIAEGPSWEWQDWPQWAPDGRTLYFVSDRSGFFDVWARHFDPGTGPVGPLVQITALNNPARMMWPLAGGRQLAIAVSRDTLMLSLSEHAGNIWMIDNVDR